MSQEGSKIVWGIGMQLTALAITLLFVFAIVWVASKAWNTGQRTTAPEKQAA